MADGTSIEWTDATWNPIVGCSIVSPGCTHCYAMGMAARIEAMTQALKAKGKTGAPHYDGTTRRVKGKARGGEDRRPERGSKSVWTGKLALAPEHILTEPLHWTRPRRIFVNSMGDLFHEDVPDEWIDRVFAVMALAPQHTFQVLTKRAARMRGYFEGRRKNFGRVSDLLQEIGHSLDEDAHQVACDRIDLFDSAGIPQKNVWLGVSAEDQTRADERIPDLLATPAAIRFASAEPLLGPIYFTRLRPPESLRWGGFPNLDALRGGWFVDGHRPDGEAEPEFRGLDWIIVGGESGRDARPMHPAWARSIRDQCATAGTAFFFKQWGAHRPLTAAERGQACGATLIGNDLYDRDAYVLRVGKKAAGRLLEGREYSDFPEARQP